MVYVLIGVLCDFELFWFGLFCVYLCFEVGRLLISRYGLFVLFYFRV